MGAAGQSLGRGGEPLMEVVHVRGDGDVDERHQELPAHADRDAEQVDPAEADAEVGGQVLGPPQPAGQDRRTEEPAPQAEQRRQHVPGGRLGQLGQGGELVVLAGQCRRHAPPARRPGPDRRGSRGRHTAATSRPAFRVDGTPPASSCLPRLTSAGPNTPASRRPGAIGRGEVGGGAPGPAASTACSGRSLTPPRYRSHPASGHRAPQRRTGPRRGTPGTPSRTHRRPPHGARDPGAMRQRHAQAHSMKR